MSRGRLVLGGAGLALLLLWLTGYPLLLTLLEALRGPAGWTLAGFSAFAARPDEWQALARSLWTSAASVALAALVGVPLAFLFERTEFPGRRLLGTLVALPVALPPLVGVVAFVFLYGESGFAARGVMALLGLEEAPWRLTGAWAILFVHTYSFFVYFYLFTRAALARRDPALAEAAASLGAGALRTFWRVTLPGLAPALGGAALLVFLNALASFSAPYLFGGSFRVMTTQITASKLNGDELAAQVETVVLALVALLALWFLSRLAGNAEDTASGVRGVAPARRQITTRAGRWAATAAGWGLAAVLLAPHATLVLISFVPPATWTTEALPPELALANYVRVFSDFQHLRPVLNSLWMATAATAGALVLGLLGALFGSRLGGRGRTGASAVERRLGRALTGLLTLPWAIPATVFAVSLATAFSVNQPEVGRFVLVGTPWILPLAYLVRSLPLTGRATIAGLSQLDPALEEAAASLGAGRWRTLRRVVLPLLAPALAAGAGLAFLSGLGDFVTSVVLYTRSTQPISIEIQESLRTQELGLAAAYGVILAGVGTAAFLWGRRAEEG